MGCGSSNEKIQQKEVKVSKEIPEYKVIVVGDAAVGKTALIHQFINGSFSRVH